MTTIWLVTSITFTTILSNIDTFRKFKIGRTAVFTDTSNRDCYLRTGAEMFKSEM